MPLERKTPLKRGARLPGPKGSINKEGALARRWKAWRTKNKAKAIERAAEKCEWHHSATCGPRQWHHVFGRGNWTSVSEPWASFHPFTTMVCLAIHDQAHTDTRVRRILQREALNRFVLLEPFNKYIDWNSYHDQYLKWEPHEIVREIIRNLNARGVTPDAELDPPAEGRQPPRP